MNYESDDPNFPDEVKNRTNIKEVALRYMTYWKWFVFSFILTLVVAFFYLKRQTPLYQIQSSILIKDDKKGIGQEDLLKQLNLLYSNKLLDNEIEILKSMTLMDKVVNGLNLNVRYYTNKRFSNPQALSTLRNFDWGYLTGDHFKLKELYTESPLALQILRPNPLIYEKPLKITIQNNDSIKLNDLLIPLDKAVETPYGLLILRSTHKNGQIKTMKIVVQPTAVVAETLIGNLKIEPSSKVSSVLLLTLLDPIPQRGCDILNKLIEYYNLAGVEDKNKVAASTLVFIEDRLKLISGELGNAEKTVENFKVGAKITDISAESNLFLQSVQQNDVALNQVKIQQQVLSEIAQYVRAKGNRSGTVPATLGINDPVLLSLINQLVDLEGKRTNMIKLVKPDNPMLQSLDEQITSLRRSLAENIVSLQKSLAVSRQQLESRNQQMEAMLKSIPGKERQLVDISRQQAIKNSLYIFLLQKREETALSYSSVESDSRPIDLPRSSNGPVSPDSGLIYLIFALAGLGLPFGTLNLIDLFNDKIRRHKDITDNTETAIIGEISEIDRNVPLVINEMDRSKFAEQIRVLRTNLTYLDPGKNLQSILFTSSLSGEGKSLISLNLGSSLAMADKKTVILEFDLRKPKLKSLLEIENSKGISNYLNRQAELSEIIIPIADHPNMSIITSGTIPHNPVELMINGRLKELFIRLRAQFDYIIIDAPPIGIITDAQILAEHADATFYVLRYNYTPKSYLKYVDALYKGNKLKNLKLIYNGIKEGGRYGYEYGYGYGNRYINSPKTSKKAKKYQFDMQENELN